MEIDSAKIKSALSSAQNETGQAVSRQAEPLEARAPERQHSGHFDREVVSAISKISIDNIRLSVAVNPDDNEAVIQLTSETTGRVVATIPAEHSRNIKKQVEIALGKIVDDKV